MKKQKTSEHQYLEALKEEAKFLSGEEKEEHEILIAQLAGDLALRESVLQGAQDDIQRARDMSAQSRRTKKDKKEIKPIVKVDFGKIGWIHEDNISEYEAERITTDDGMVIDFLDLTELSRITSDQFDKLEAEGVANGLLEIVKQQTIPKLWRGVIEGSSGRPVSIGGMRLKDVPASRSLNTSYPGYKEDVHGTDNRAILLILDRNDDGIPAIALAALYDHDDDRAIHNALFLKQK